MHLVDANALGLRDIHTGASCDDNQGGESRPFLVFSFHIGITITLKEVLSSYLLRGREKIPYLKYEERKRIAFPCNVSSDTKLLTFLRTISLQCCKLTEGIRGWTRASAHTQSLDVRISSRTLPSLRVCAASHTRTKRRAKYTIFSGARGVVASNDQGFSMKNNSLSARQSSASRPFGPTARASEREAARSVSSLWFALLVEDNRPASACRASARPRAAGEASPTPANPRSSLAPLPAPSRARTLTFGFCHAEIAEVFSCWESQVLAKRRRSPVAQRSRQSRELSGRRAYCRTENRHPISAQDFTRVMFGASAKSRFHGRSNTSTRVFVHAASADRMSGESSIAMS